MANKNKNTEKLVESADHDAGAEFEAEPLLRSMSDTRPEIEVDAVTFDIDDRLDDLTPRTKGELKRDVSEKAAEIEALKFELEQLSGLKRSVDEELKSRVEITDNLQNEITESQQRLEHALAEVDSHKEKLRQQQLDIESAQAKQTTLQERSGEHNATVKQIKQKNKKLESELAAKENQLRSLEKKLKKQSQRESDATTRQLNAELRNITRSLRLSRAEVADLKAYIDGRTGEWTKLQSEVERTSDQISADQEQLQVLQAEIDDRNAQLVRTREQIIETSEKLARQKTTVRKLRNQNRELERALHEEANPEIEQSRQRIDKQQGEIARLSQSNADIREERDKLTEYADSLRMQLQDQISISKVSVAMREKLEAGLDAANLAINELSQRFEAEVRRAEELEQSNESMQKDFEHQMRQVRFELGAAEETIAGHQTINEQLVSDLFDNRSFQQALESQLGEVEKESNKSVSDLDSQLKKVRRDAEDLERKLRNKDSVITELMQELAGRSDAIELKDESNSVLHKIDGFKAEDNKEASHSEKDRVTRQLIGNADGKELRFPLFKNRLTIGRTAHNDIQLNMQYISRRHAVISTDHGQTRVIDWGSKNGVFVNGTEITERILESGDIVTIGTTDFRYEERFKR